MRIQLTWLCFLVAALVVVASGVLPLPWLTPSALPTVLVEAELAFLLVLWPLLLPRTLVEANLEGGTRRDLVAAAAQILTLAVIATPLAVLCARTAEAGAWASWVAQAFPAGVAAGVGLLSVASRRSGRDPSRPYFLAVVTLSVGLPLAGFVLREVGGHADLSLAACSPFRAAIEGGLAPWALVAALLVSAGSCAVWPRRSSSSC